MKAIIKSALLAIIAIATSYFQAIADGTQSQKNDDEYYNYELTTDLKVTCYDYDIDAVDNNTSKMAASGLRFKVISSELEDKTLGKFYIIQFPLISDKEADALKHNTRIINSTNTGISTYWCIKSADFNDPSKVRKRYATGWYNKKPVFGQLTIPFKIRPKLGNRPADFTGDFTIGASGGIGFRLSHYKKNYLNFSLGGGVTSVAVDSASTDGFVKETTKWTALTGAFAITLDLSGFQVGAVTGFDFVGGNPGSTWAYNKNIWFSVGIGYQFIKPKD